MGKAIVFSILAATVVIPLFYARDGRHNRALRKTKIGFAVFCTFWVFATLFLSNRI